ncbi:hypothetical protein [Commensalibacter sp. Nvir]|uniref:hypothetical protein n=1 Tax=Commensalibacter sp. Nvir TaxID=3069817 RepID=UPI0030C81593
MSGTMSISWQTPTSVLSSHQKSNKIEISIGKAYSLELHNKSSVQFAVRPQEPGGRISYAGLVSFNVRQVGTYRIITNGRPWIDIVQKGKIIDAKAHQHGENCQGAEKILDYALSPGDYDMEVASSGKKKIKLFIIPVL